MGYCARPGNVAVAHAAAELGACDVAIQKRVDLLDLRGDLAAHFLDQAVEPVRLQRSQHRGKISLAFDGFGERPAIRRVQERHHELGVLYQSRLIIAELLGGQLGWVIGCGPDPTESSEKLVMAGRYRRCPQKKSHRQRIHQLVIETLVARDIRHGRVSRRAIAGRIDNAHVGGAQAQAVPHRPLDQTFGIDAAGEMNVEVGALRHAPQERAHRGVVITQRFETRRSDYCGEVACDNDETRNEKCCRKGKNGDNGRASQDLILGAPQRRGREPSA